MHDNSNRIKKSPRFSSWGFLYVSELSQLVEDNDVGGLKALGTLFNCELNPLAFLQVLETFALNGGEVYEDICAAFASDEAVALRPIEPLDCTVDTFRHVCLLGKKKIWRVLILYCIGVRLNGVKQSGSQMIREPTWYFQSKLLVSYNRKDNMSSEMCQRISGDLTGLTYPVSLALLRSNNL